MLDLDPVLSDEEAAMVVTVQDMRRVGACVRGQKRWFESKGLDFRAIMQNGITVWDMLKHYDGEVKQVIERVVTMKRGEANGR